MTTIKDYIRDFAIDVSIKHKDQEDLDLIYIDDKLDELMEDIARKFLGIKA